MKINGLIHQFTFGMLIVAIWLLSSCTNLYEDLPECRLFVKFKYDYNMLYADAFHTQVDKVELYVFDKDGKYLFIHLGMERIRIKHIIVILELDEQTAFRQILIEIGT